MEKYIKPKTNKSIDADRTQDIHSFLSTVIAVHVSSEFCKNYFSLSVFQFHQRNILNFGSKTDVSNGRTINEVAHVTCNSTVLERLDATQTIITQNAFLSF